MSDKPSKDGWRRHRFDQMAVIVNDRIENPAEADVAHYVGLEHLDTESLTIKRWGSPSDVEATKLRFRTGDIIFGRRRVYQRKLAVADFDGICSAHAMVLRAKPEVALSEFLPFFMQSEVFMERAKRISVGSLSPTINWKTLAREEFDLPPLEEQRNVAVVLREAAAVRAAVEVAADRCREAYRAISASWFSEILSKEDSRSESLGMYFMDISDKGHAGLPILSVTIDGRVVRREQLGRHVSDDTGDGKYIRVQAGDIAYNTMRLWQGAVGIVEEEGLISPAYTVLRIQRDNLPPEYFWEMLRSPALQQEYRRLVRGVASDRWRLYFKDLASVQIHMPGVEVVHKTVRALTEIRAATERLGDHSRASASFLTALRREILGS